MSVLFLTVVNLVLRNKLIQSVLVAKAVIHRTYIQLLSKLYFCYYEDLLLILNGMNDIFILSKIFELLIQEVVTWQNTWLKHKFRMKAPKTALSEQIKF